MYRFIKRIIKYTINYLSGIKYLNVKNPRIVVNNENLQKNILLISHNSQKAGAPVLLEQIAKNLKDNGYNIIIISRRYGDMIYRFRSICHTTICFSKIGLKSKLKQFHSLNYRNVICNTVINGDLVQALRNWGFITVSLIHELPNAIEELNAIDKAISIAKYSDKVVFPSEFVYHKFCSITKFSFNHIIKTQGLYLKKNYICNKQVSLKKINEMFGYEINSNVILNVGTINKRKGFDVFLGMASKDTSNQYIWVGDTNSRYYNYCLSNYAKETPSNLLLPGYIDDPDLLACFYDIADIFALTSREEPFGTIVLEAFNASTPVVAFEGAGGYLDIVKNGSTGILTEYESIDNMISAIHYLLDNPNIMKKMKNNCKEIVATYSFDEYVTFLEGLFTKEDRD